MNRSNHDPHPVRAHEHDPHRAEASQFEELMQEVMGNADRFGHCQHVQLTWLAVRRYGTAAAMDGKRPGQDRMGRARPRALPLATRSWVRFPGAERIGSEQVRLRLASALGLLDDEGALLHAPVVGLSSG